MEILSILFSLVFFCGVRSESDEDADYSDSCLPQLADRCFKGLMPSLVCQMENKGSCSQLGNFCSLAAESLQCAADIIDNDCKEGKTNFDAWLKGLRAVREKICGGNADILRVVTDSPCFNIDEFVECVEEITRVTHVLDLLQVTLNTNECNRLLIALPTCNVRAHASHSVCYLPQDAINDVIYTFFSQTECGVSCRQKSQGASLSDGSHLFTFFAVIFSLIKSTLIK